MTSSTIDRANLAEIPVIDISGTESEVEIGKRLVDASEIHGFVFIKNLGRDIPIPVIDRSFELSKKFFASPIEEKQTCLYREDNTGWSGMNQETLDPSSQEVGDFKEAFNFGEFSNGKAQQPLTPFLASHESEISDFFETCRALCLKLLTLFGLGLGTSPPTWLSSRHSRDLGPSGSILRYLHYPSLSASPDYRPDVDIRAGAHSDYGSLTLLFQRPSQPGLEVLTPSGAWVPVPVFPPGTENEPSPPILVNIGDLLSYWTNGLLRSTVHRVIFPKKQDGTLGTDDRYSMAFFCHPANETKLDPVPSARVKERGSGEVQEGTEGTEGRVITALEHLHNKLKASYLGVDFDKKGE